MVGAQSMKEYKVACREPPIARGIPARRKNEEGKRRFPNVETFQMCSPHASQSKRDDENPPFSKNENLIASTKNFKQEN